MKLPKGSLKWKITYILVYPIAKFLLGIRVYGNENVPKEGPVILAPNHRSYIDPPVVGFAAGRETYFLAKEELFRFKPFAILMKFYNAIPLKRSLEAKDTLFYAIEILKNNGAIVVFPEGTRNKTSQNLLPFKLGISFLAFQTNAKIVPIYIKNNQGRALIKPFLWILRIRRLEVYIGKPIDINDFENTRKGQVELTKRLYYEISKLIENAK
ncbi:MAG: 1-acyl-sn-glycerol-3-phosphate acyltransferase [candidate division WOR-3 bacterium]|nr:1-acyl-sn-glycerol-3-phosphate acyltransferase [candidate division WOR-3 bacterium]MCX7948337.1 1-acyl-sn-glycerol-3-phosphate acyltransferase [candidate division WOR-3 bacterium]MDW8150835.1 lysophospholipid acyltransferase family protein [candidate division WOR-3 bacterium]